jgi:hypothetical protein
VIVSLVILIDFEMTSYKVVTLTYCGMIFYREVSSSEIFYEVVSETYAFFLVT